MRFGQRVATLPENIVIGLQSKAGADEVVTIDSVPHIGQSVHIVEGPFQGLEVVVTQLLPAKERIRVLLDFLGRSLEMEVPAGKSAPRLRVDPGTKHKVAVQRNSHFASQRREDRDAYWKFVNWLGSAAPYPARPTPCPATSQSFRHRGQGY
jgi:hypothetical protein